MLPAGDTGFQAASMVDDDGHLISTDLSPAMLDVGRRRGAELGLGNVEFGSFMADTAGPVAIALQKLSDQDR